MQKKRLDEIMVERGLADSLSEAQTLVMAGEVRVDGQMVWNPSIRFAPSARVEAAQGRKYVSRGGEKLEGGLVTFSLEDLSGRICADIGASTGGFTDCLLQHGAAKVYAVDVGYGILHWKLRSDPRVISMERTNARYIERFPEPVSLVTMDASFISLRVLLSPVSQWFGGVGEVVALIKPQFEASRSEVDRGEGVIDNPKVHRQVLHEILKFSQEQGFTVLGLVRSSIKGPKGNQEFLVHLVYPKQSEDGQDSYPVTQMIDQALSA